MKDYMKNIGVIILLTLLPFSSRAQQLTDRYNSQRPLVITCDWDKPPYEFLNDKGEPAGSNIDVMLAICKELHIPCKFNMKEWGGAIKTFERGEADIILANTRRYTNNPKYFWTNNIINYNRIVAATVKDTTGIISIPRLVESGVVLKPSDYSVFYFMAEDSAYLARMEFQSPKVAIMGVVDGDYQYFIWGEEPIKWKLQELNIEGVDLVDVNIPISEIHIIGRDKELIEAIDDTYSRLKHRGDLEEITNRWFHPDRVVAKTSPVILYVILYILLAGVLVYLIYRLSKAHVRRATRESSDLNNMIYKALHMGSYHILQYDIAADRMANRYGVILPAEGITLEEFNSRIHPDDRGEFSAKISHLLNGRDRKFEMDMRWNMGTVKAPQWQFLEGHGIVELDQHGRPAYVLNVVHNITHDVEEEQNTYEMEKSYEVLSRMPGMATSFYDANGFLVELNEHMRELCGMNNNPNVERFWRQVCIFDMPVFRGVFSPDFRHDFYACQHMLYQDLGVDRYIEFTVRPLFNSKGDLTNYFCCVFDVTDEFDSHNQLLVLKNEISRINNDINFYDRQLTTLVESGNIYMWHTHLDEDKMWFYRSLRPYSQTAESISDFISHMVEAEQDVARYYFTNTSPEQAEMKAVYHFDNSVLADGECWLDMTATPLRDSQGNVFGHHGISFDVTQTVQLQRELREVTKKAEASNQLKSGFMASMTHELRTPLNAIMGFTEVLRATEEPEERAEYIRIVRNSCDMLVRLINDIFEASTITDGPSSIEPAEVEFSKSFDDICLMLEQRVTEKGLKFIKENPYYSFCTVLDMGRMQQIITNFVTNAVKFTEQGHIRVGYRITTPDDTLDVLEGNPRFAHKDGLYIYCEDTGSGIPKDKQNLIFQRFVKLNEYVQGTGLGLNICQSIAERCGGTIGVRSEGEGKGSTFWVWIPAKAN